MATLTVPDERLPKGKVVTAVCPRCKGPISIDMTADARSMLPHRPLPIPAEEPKGYQRRAAARAHA
jgi:hypothetical protein